MWLALTLVSAIQALESSLTSHLVLQQVALGESLFASESPPPIPLNCRSWAGHLQPHFS